MSTALGVLTEEPFNKLGEELHNKTNALKEKMNLWDWKLGKWHTSSGSRTQHQDSKIEIHRMNHDSRVLLRR